ncbi:MAG: hypothetical protein NZ518_09870, partial [Dehalococcoidia bacterium]|nr:hypothetical protein [Dehalococcoidia bacterium]
MTMANAVATPLRWHAVTRAIRRVPSPPPWDWLTPWQRLGVVALCVAAAVVAASQPVTYVIAAIAGLTLFVVALVRPDVGLALVFFS